MIGRARARARRSRRAELQLLVPCRDGVRENNPLIVMGPSIAKVFADHGWRKDDIRQYLYDTSGSLPMTQSATPITSACRLPPARSGRERPAVAGLLRIGRSETACARVPQPRVDRASSLAGRSRAATSPSVTAQSHARTAGEPQSRSAAKVGRALPRVTLTLTRPLSQGRGQIRDAYAADARLHKN